MYRKDTQNSVSRSEMSTNRHQPLQQQSTPFHCTKSPAHPHAVVPNVLMYVGEQTS